MKFLTMVLAALVTAGTAQATTALPINVAALQATLLAEAAPQGLDWRVGDKANFNITIGTFIKGTSNTYVREIVEPSAWMIQDMDLGAMGKQKMEILINKNTGAIEKLIVNGQEQKVPDSSNTKILETKEANITVPAGTFACIYAKVQSGTQIEEAWLNPKAIPLGGNLKVLADSQLGKVTEELTSFEFAPRQ
jgi:hypothetical protein